MCVLDMERGTWNGLGVGELVWSFLGMSVSGLSVGFGGESCRGVCCCVRGGVPSPTVFVPTMESDSQVSRQGPVVDVCRAFMDSRTSRNRGYDSSCSTTPTMTTQPDHQHEATTPEQENLP